MINFEKTIKIMKKVIVFSVIVSAIIAIVFNSCYKDKLMNRIVNYDTREIKDFNIRGVDVSHHQGHINWASVKKDNIKFAIMKCTEGTGFVDKRFKYNLINAKKNGLLVGAYHYYRVDFDPIKQFNNVKRVVPKNSLDIPFVIDLEIMSNESLRDPKNHPKFIKNLKIFERKIHEYYGEKPIFYATPYFYIHRLQKDFDNKLWAADYKSTKLTYFSSSTWCMWQYSCTGNVKGINGGVDMNVFKGSYQELLNL